MGLFSRNKGQQRQQSPPSERGPPPAPSSIPLYEPVPSIHPAWTTPVVHPPSSLAATSPQPEPSPAQYQQQLFLQTYQTLNPAQQLPYAGQLPPYAAQQNGTAAAAAAGGGAMPAVAMGTATIDKDGGGTTSRALLRQAVQAAAREGRPLTVNFVAQMQPVMTHNPYGIDVPHQHPYGPPQGAGDVPVGAAAAPPQMAPPGELQPELVQDQYESIRIPALPDMRSLPAELQDFRDQCATGVRQAVAMITAMEHQLWWERSRRQQAEEDCKVLLAAVHMERGVGEALLGAEERRRAEAAEAAAKLTLAADQLPQASEAATTIQKHIRGHRARKEFESHLRDILRGVDPSLDPAALPAAAQSHVSHVNASGAPRRLGLRTLLGEVVDRTPGAGGGASSALPREQAEAAEYYRRQVDRIGQRLAAHKDAGEPHPGDRSGDPLLSDVKQLLSGSYPASSAQVIAALVRRCRELQAALLEAVGELEAAQLSIQGLKETNARVSELSGVRADLEASRQDNLRLAATVARLRTAMSVQSAGGAAPGGAAAAVAARENPYVAAWYRRAYADQEWQRVPPGGVGLMDGPDAAVETWEDLRAANPEPVLMPQIAVPGMQYNDLMGLKMDMIMGGASQGPPDPLYGMSVPDRAAFRYERDTPLVPMQTTAPLIRESLPPMTYPAPEWGPAAAAVGSRGGGGASSMAAGARSGSAGGGWPAGGGGSGAAAAARYNRDTPVVPVYSVLPLIREDEFVRRSLSPPRDTREALPPPGTPPLLQPQPQPSGLGAASAGPPSRQPSTAMSTNMQYIRDRASAPPPAPTQQQQTSVPPEVVAAAAVAATMPPLAQQQTAGPAAAAIGGNAYRGAGYGHRYS